VEARLAAVETTPACMSAHDAKPKGVEADPGMTSALVQERGDRREFLAGPERVRQISSMLFYG
jgi:hypothetical protein